tara:strand:- start:153 stop:2390 length:2238 start_codon:yes stop_codon:yes gene_type:complete
MKKYLLYVLIFPSILSFGQSDGDTIIVQTFDYGMTYGQAWGPPRDTIAHFPNNPTLTFEKIIMAYSMRCKDDIVNTSGGNNVGCGEWDYSCHTYIHDSTRIDSLLATITSHTITGFNGNTYSYSVNPVYNYYYVYQQNILILDSVLALPDTIIERIVFPNYGTLFHDSISIDTNIYWQSLSYTYDTSGNVVSLDTTQIDGVINITDLLYYNRYPMAFQIMSFVTPYGNGLDLGPDGKTWYFDLTDYAPVFKGDKRITVSGGGQWQEDMDIKFYFIVGTPPREVIDAQQIWKPQSKSYTSIMADDVFEIRDMKLDPNAIAYKIKTVITGHGQEGEFIPRTHFINIDGGSSEFSWQAWKECSENPIFPQGGTWIHDRAGWCPGMASDMREDMITSFVTPGSVHSVDYGVTTAAGSSNYWVSSQLISYGDPNFTLDAAVIDILSPTNKVNYERKNPICSKPKVIIQNTGNTTITSLTIEYWINNATSKEIFTWNGNLSFLEKEEVELPDPSSLWDNIILTNNIFHAVISLPNNGTDEYSYNNNLSSTFEPSPTYPNTFALWVQTNSGDIGGVSETSWEITDNNGLSIFTGTNLSVNQQYRDTLTFVDGCYVLKVNDTDDDGLDFWANSDGAGYIKLRNVPGTWFADFDGDFGRFIHHEFRVEDALSTSEISNINIEVYPNPATNKILVSGDLSNSSKLILTDNIGRTVSITNIEKNNTTQKIDISNLSKGIYFISVDDNKIIKKVVKQ